MKRIALIAILFQGCESSPTAVVGPSEVTPNPASTSPSPISVAGAPPSPVNGQPAGDGELSWRLSPSVDTWTVEVTNSFDKDKNVYAACFHDPDRNIATQTHYNPRPIDRGVVHPGEARTFSAPIPCGQWQCDAVEGEVVPKTSPFFGKNLIVGRIGTRACAPPPPPPPPPPPETCKETPRCDTWVEVSLGEFPSTWVFSNWRVENWCGRLELTRDDGFVFYSEDVCAECGDEVISGNRMSDTFDPESYESTWSLKCIEENGSARN